MIELLQKELTSEVLNAFFYVYNQLGYGFLEKVYENALAHELRKRGHAVTQQMSIDVHYDGIKVGEYFADMLVDRLVIVEIKSAESISKQHKTQLMNYLKATQIEVGLLLNFGPKPEFRRLIATNQHYQSSSNIRKQK